eukprot:PITA_27306
MKGLRQGCPLSPLLFVLQAFVLSFYLDKKRANQDIAGLCIARGVKTINHAFFADDTLLLGAASGIIASRFKKALDEFCLVSRSSLNKGKCHIYCWNITSSLLNSISRTFGFAASSNWTSFKYLGLPVFLKKAYSRDWLPQLEKFKNKLLVWGYSSLNIAGKSVLIKSVLSSLPLFQFSVLLAPTGILRKMEETIRKFFWKGGKQKEKKILLVNWECISKPLLEGGLNFKNLGYHNVAMGAKLIWRIIAPKPGWAQLALWKKYFKGQRSRCLDHPKKHTNTSFLKLCSKACSLIKDHAFWVLGNGKRINLWTDKILNNEALGDCHSLQTLRRWMNEAGLRTLWDISAWQNSRWAGWNLQTPPELSMERKTLISKLHDLSPLLARKRDTRGWGTPTGGYSIAQGYAKLCDRPHVATNPEPWKGIWHYPTLAKIYFFSWLLCHSKILTDDNLQKRGFHSPSRCNLCKVNHESVVHLMLECTFTLQIWTELLGTLSFGIVLPSSIPNIFTKWLQRYLGTPPKNKIIRVAWTALPKIICWQVWLERNKRIFRNHEQEAKLVAVKIKSQLKENLRDIKDDLNLSQQDINWGSFLGLQFQNSANSISLLQDCFAWGLGIDSNIQAKALALFQGLKIMKMLNIREANVIGESQVIINIMVTHSKPMDLRLARLIFRVTDLRDSFQKLNFYHVLRANNKEADIEANKAALLMVGALLRGGQESWEPIP